MKRLNLITAFGLALCLSGLLQAQTENIQYKRQYDKKGINVFETSKKNDVAFDGLKLEFGAGFTQSYQGLKHKNNNGGVPANRLYPLTSGFNTANANLFMDAQLADGIHLNLTSYLSSRHHNETWVKGGYIQMDKVPFKGNFWDKLMEVSTIKVGHMEINYGDAHFRRSDGGQTMYNPFVENYIIDEFATEIGGEYYFQKSGFLGMVGISNGMIKGNVDSITPTPQDKNTDKALSVYVKGAYDKQISDNLRVRFAASYYHNGSSGGNTLFGGDRTGSNYFMVVEKAGGTYAANAFSGRLNPLFSKKVDTYQFNQFTKAYGFELFTTYEFGKGRTKAETKERDMKQFAVDGVYRFGSSENFFGGVRYNTVTAELVGFTKEISINRIALAAGWFVMPNMMLKAELVSQKYEDFPTTDYRYKGKFDGYVIQAAVSF